ncbi:hypothetical protein [Tenacibaculum finnmarkense]|uniref:hypothetical protein n=1 Tax=Tenacibaculum finnmarkense TaxID=2781243 RepID=UPI001E32A1C4|nr:hypothetical protein [Tenacibaculum finnmarkense]MCD8413658.1 hypothetical protein [Tenacibaculum finnmarkense genomovar ulcerans]
MKIKLNKNDFEYLFKIFDSLPIELNYQKTNNLNVVIEGNEAVIEKTLDKLSDLLADKGFDSSNNLNHIGNRIEKIIDAISIVFYD